MKWVKHDTDANQDAKLQNVLLDYGLEGYGLYWYCIELIAGKVDKDNITFELEHDARIIARNTGSTAQKVEEMMRYFVDQGLFENCHGTITCLKLAKRLDKSMTSNPEMRKIIEGLKSHDSIMTESENPMQDKIRLEENRKTLGSSDDKPKENLSKKKYPVDFESVWAVKPERQGGNPKNKAFQAWSARKRSGVTSAEMAEGMLRYKQFMQSEGKIGTQFVMQMATFFGPDEHFKEQWTFNSPQQQQQTRKINDL